MKKPDKKLKWDKPILFILNRGNSEEIISLGICRGVSTGGPGSMHGGCFQNTPAHVCDTCSMVYD
jgi:tRNA uridine 5-carbamoylmethylation protein Kti12